METIDYCILIDFEATSESTDDELTRLQQCDVHEIIEFVRATPAAAAAPPPRAMRGLGRECGTPTA